MSRQPRDHERVAPEIEVGQQQDLEQAEHLQAAPSAARRNSGTASGDRPTMATTRGAAAMTSAVEAICTAAAPRRMCFASTEISSACCFSSRSGAPASSSA